MKVSILIPLYNAAQYIGATIESALNQTYADKEIIVLDDGSKDDSLKIAHQYKKFGVIVESQENSGSTKTRNKLLELSKGELIQYLDADDLLSVTKIENQVQAIKKYGLDFLYSCPWGKFVNCTERVSFIKQPLWIDANPRDWLLLSWNGGGMMQTACWLTHRSLIIESGGWNESLLENPADDGEFFARVILKSKGIKFVQDSKVYYREGHTSRVSTNKSTNAIKSLLGNCISYEQHMLQRYNDPEVRQILAKNYQTFIYHFYGSHQDFIQEAKSRINKLGISKVDPIGGKNFIRISRIMGFENALRLRSIFKK